MFIFTKILCENLWFEKSRKYLFLQSVYGRSTLHKTGSLEEHARNVVRYREAQTENIKMGIRVNPASTNLLTVGNDIPRYGILANFIGHHFKKECKRGNNVKRITPRIFLGFRHLKMTIKTMTSTRSEILFLKKYSIRLFKSISKMIRWQRKVEDHHKKPKIIWFWRTFEFNLLKSYSNQ